MNESGLAFIKAAPSSGQRSADTSENRAAAPTIALAQFSCQTLCPALTGGASAFWSSLEAARRKTSFNTHSKGFDYERRSYTAG